MIPTGVKKSHGGPATGVGNPAAPIMIVGESWGEDEERHGEPFVGASGMELNRMLAEAGFNRSQCYVTNLVNARPPSNDIGKWFALSKKAITPAHVPVRDKWALPIVAEGYASLLREIDLVRPRLFLAFGNYALWALTGHFGIGKWRGSMLPGPQGALVIPTYHPAYILRMWSERADAMADLRRAFREFTSPTPLPKWAITVRPTFSQVIRTLDALHTRVTTSPTWIEMDYETKRGHIDCIGLSWSSTEAISIPFITDANQEGYWSAQEETRIVYLLYKILTHGNARVRGQNLLYDCQYCYRYWHFIPRVAQDTMISQHTLWAGRRKSLDYQSSLYSAHYVQWKPEKAEWKEGG